MDDDEDMDDEDDEFPTGAATSSNNRLNFSSGDSDADSDNNDMEQRGTKRRRRHNAAGSKQPAPNIHSLRERERRFRLKKLLVRLQISFLVGTPDELNDEEAVERLSSKFSPTKSSKQSILAEVSLAQMGKLEFKNRFF